MELCVKAVDGRSIFDDQQQSGGTSALVPGKEFWEFLLSVLMLVDYSCYLLLFLWLCFVILQSVVPFAAFIVLVFFFLIHIWMCIWKIERRPQPHLEEKHHLPIQSVQMKRISLSALLLLPPARGGGGAVTRRVSFQLPVETLLCCVSLLNQRRVAETTSACWPPRCACCITSFFTGSQRYVKVKRQTFDASLCSPALQGELLRRRQRAVADDWPDIYQTKD